MKRKTFEIIIALIGLVVGIIWWKTGDGNWEPILVAATSIGGLLYAIFLEDGSEQLLKTIKMKQKAGNKSKNYQSGGDITIYNTKDDVE